MQDIHQIFYRGQAISARDVRSEVSVTSRNAVSGIKAVMMLPHYIVVRTTYIGQPEKIGKIFDMFHFGVIVTRWPVASLQKLNEICNDTIPSQHTLYK
jgi:hypothetical protein